MAIRNKKFYERMNRVNDKLASMNLSGSQNRYCWALFRKTFGFGKYEDRISRSQISEITGMLEINVSRTKRELKKGNIIYCNGKIQGFNLNTDLWEKVSIRIPIEKVSQGIQKGIHQAKKKGIHRDTYKETTKKLTKEGGAVLEIRRSQEIDKMEGKEWLRAMMIEIQEYSKKFTDRFLSKAEFTPCYDAWLELQEAMNIRDREAWLLAKLERGPAPEE